MKPAPAAGPAPGAHARVACPRCPRRYQVPAQAAGKTLTCKGCGTAFPVTLLGRYQLLDQLGSGTFGTVWRGFEGDLGRFVAVKVLHDHWTADAQIVARFRNEARILARIVHPNVVPLFGYGEQGTRTHFVSALVPGTKLLAQIPPGGFADPARAVRVAVTVLEALEHVHTTHKVWHRDINPNNIMVDDRDFVYVLDFGIAACRDLDANFKTAPGSTLGTPAYSSPEQIDGRLEWVGPWSDQYSLGVVLYHMLAGQLPFQGPGQMIFVEILTHAPPPPSSFRRDLDPGLERLVLRALAKDPKDRYPSCRAFADALRGWAAGPAPAAPAESPAVRRWAVAGAAAAAAAVAVAAVTLAVAVWLGPGITKETWTPPDFPATSTAPRGPALQPVPKKDAP